MPVSCLTASQDGSLVAFGTDQMKVPVTVVDTSVSVDTNRDNDADSDAEIDEDERQSLIGFVDTRSSEVVGW